MTEGQRLTEEYKKSLCSEYEACCEPMRKAHRRGTDAEGYGPTMYAGDLAGCGSDPTNYCPWCGARLMEGDK